MGDEAGNTVLRTIETAHAVTDAVNRHDLEALTRLWSTGVAETVPFVGTLHGRDALGAYFAEMFAALPDFGLVTERTAASGETVFVQWRMTGTFSGGSWNGIQPTGRPIDLRGMDCMTIRYGELVANLVAYDTLAFIQQAGISM